MSRSKIAIILQLYHCIDLISTHTTCQGMVQ